VELKTNRMSFHGKNAYKPELADRVPIKNYTFVHLSQDGIVTDAEMQSTPVAIGQWEARIPTAPPHVSHFDTPTTGASRGTIDQFIYDLNRVDPHYTYRLPTEAEWENMVKNPSPDFVRDPKVFEFVESPSLEPIVRRADSEADFNNPENRFSVAPRQAFNNCTFRLVRVKK